MKTSDTVVKISPALVDVQEWLAAKDDQYNPFFKSKYADISTILNAIRPKMKECGIGILQSIAVSDNRKMTCTTRIIHESGEWIESEFSLEAANSKPQDYGSAATYVRRYGMCAALCIATNEAEDDDGNEADKEKQKELLQCKNEELHAKTSGLILRAVDKYGLEVIIQAFEDHGYKAELEAETDAEVVKSLTSQVSKAEKLEAIGKSLKVVKDRMDSSDG
jgi:valyl-tRNA synthetase